MVVAVPMHDGVVVCGRVSPEISPVLVNDGCEGLSARRSVYRGDYDSNTNVITWQQVNGNPDQALTDVATSANIQIAAHDDGANTTLYVGLANQVDGIDGITAPLTGVFRSTDAGANWTPLGTPARFNAFSVSGSGFNLIADGDPANNQVVYIAGLGDSQIFRNNGVNGTWTQIAGPGNASDDTTPHADSRDMSFIGNNTLVEADDGGIFYLTTPTPQHPLSPGGRGWRAAEHAEACEPGEGDRPLDNRFCANTPHPLPQGERAVSPATCQRSPTRACNVRNRMFPTLEPATPGDSSGPPA